MGSKSKILYFTVLIVNIVCFLLDFLPIEFPFFRISFGVSLILIGLLLVVRAVNYKIDSSMFFGVILLLFGVLNLVLYFGHLKLGLDANELWPYYLFAVAVGSFITSVYFRDRLQFKIFILFLGFGLITLLFIRHLLILWLYITLMIVWFVVYFTVNIILNKRRKR